MNRFLPKDFIYITCSFFIVAFGQPSSLPLFAILSQIGAFALFWHALERIKFKKNIFLISLIWFTGIQAVQLSWMTATDYQGFYIYVVYVGLCAAIGAQFALLSLAVTHIKCPSWLHAMIIASFWTLLEWSRLYFFTGFPWNPVGLALAANTYSAQMAAASGIYGLSFWLIFVNVFALDAFRQKFSFASILLWVLTLILPFISGVGHIAQYEQSEVLATPNVLLVHTALTPDQKLPGRTKQNPIVQSFLNWEVLLQKLSAYQEEKVDLIVFPETVVALWAKYPLYPYESVKKVFLKCFSKDCINKLPRSKEEKVGNLFYLQAIANLFHADIVAGLDDVDEEGLNNRKSYNAAFHLSPLGENPKRYEKRILLPGAEYLPFTCFESIAAYYGIHGAFTPGSEAKIFQTKDQWKFGIAICNEEIYPHIGREARQKGAKCLISIHNDVWYPYSTLAKQHFQHGRLRAIENGIPLLRSTNVGQTIALDSFGRIVSKPHENLWKQEIIQTQIKIINVITPYSIWGDQLIILISLLGTVIGFVVLFRN